MFNNRKYRFFLDKKYFDAKMKNLILEGMFFVL